MNTEIEEKRMYMLLNILSANGGTIEEWLNIKTKQDEESILAKHRNNNK